MRRAPKLVSDMTKDRGMTQFAAKKLSASP